MVRATTPVMRQFERAKSEHPDALLFFRMGDFYELFHDDAKEASRLLDITLTARRDGVPMAGVPVKAVDGYLRRLVDLGRRVAICEQVEDARKAKGIVKRAVVRVVTPGTITEDGNLDVRRNNYLAALHAPAHGSARGRPPVAGLAWVDLSTGAFRFADVPVERLADELARIEPAELLVPEGELDGERVADVRRAVREFESLLPAAETVDGAGSPASADPRNSRRRAVPKWQFARADAQRVLCEHFGVGDLAGFGLDGSFGVGSGSDSGRANEPPAALGACGALLAYLAETQKTSLPHLRRPRRHDTGAHMVLDRVTLRCLEVVANQRDGRRGGTLLAVVDRTCTAMGARLMRHRLTAPPAAIAPITARHDAVEHLLRDGGGRAALREALDAVHDLERLVARLATGRATPRDVLALGRSLAQVPAVRSALAQGDVAGTPEAAAEQALPELLGELHGRADPLADVRDDVLATIAEAPPVAVRDGGVVRDGVDAELDEIRGLARNAKQVLAEFQRRESERTGISNLRVGYTSVFGYFIEVSRGQVANVPDDYVRRQTLKNVERYITPELKEYEERILTADERSKEIEERLFTGLRERIAAKIDRLLDTASALARIDVLAAFAEVAAERGWTRPVVDDSGALDIRQGRHPVLELPSAATGGEPFVPNDALLDTEASHVVLITGPNMSGKSTYIRQTALLALLAHVGSFVPAESARFGLVDRIMARVGASDDISRGRSTFMVEMTETANILHHATPRSLVVLDEVGRGTSTYDGVALAWAITEHLATESRCRTMFATHYHELTSMPETSGELGRRVRNARVAVREWGDRVVFLRRIEDGGTDRSYGIHVARLAGLPDGVVDRARDVLARLEEARDDSAAATGPGRQLALFGAPSDRSTGHRSPPPSPPQPSARSAPSEAERAVLGALRDVDPNGTTPLDALLLLASLSERLTTDERDDDARHGDAPAGGEADARERPGARGVA